jgi:hypothetical protein
MATTIQELIEELNTKADSYDFRDIRRAGFRILAQALREARDLDVAKADLHYFLNDPANEITQEEQALALTCLNHLYLKEKPPLKIARKEGMRLSLDLRETNLTTELKRTLHYTQGTMIIKITATEIEITEIE